MDNWLYSTVNAFRARWTPNGVLREPTGSNGAQWGVTQDNDGKMWFQGGASGLPVLLPVPGRLRQLQRARSIREGLRDSVGRAGSHRRHAGRHAVRAHARRHAQPGDRRRGQRRVSAAIGCRRISSATTSTASRSRRIVRRARPVVTEGLTQLRNAYRWNEFIKSTDPLFRPVDMATAPDGTMYIVDMYRGIIQEAQWSGRGTYLRAQDQSVRARQGPQPRPDLAADATTGMARDRTQPRMLNETPAQLVTHLSHPNGWWRDTAQQLLVLKQDKSVVPALAAAGAHLAEPAGPVPRAVDARRTGRARRARSCAS